MNPIRSIVPPKSSLCPCQCTYYTNDGQVVDRIGFRETRRHEFGNWRVQKQETRTFELASPPSHGDVRVPWAQPGAAARQPEAPTSSYKVGANSFATRRPVSSFEFRDVQYGLMSHADDYSWFDALKLLHMCKCESSVAPDTSIDNVNLIAYLRAPVALIAYK